MGKFTDRLLFFGWFVAWLLMGDARYEHAMKETFAETIVRVFSDD